MTLTPELALIIVAVIGAAASCFVGVRNSKTLQDVHVIVNSRYNDIVTELKTANAEAIKLRQDISDLRIAAAEKRNP